HGKTGKSATVSRADRPVPSWRKIVDTDPKAAREISVATRAIGGAHDIAVGVAGRVVGGGVYAGGFRGGAACNDPWVCDPWCWNGGWSVGCSWGWGSSSWCAGP